MIEKFSKDESVKEVKENIDEKINMSENKEKLKKLEETGKYLFHGSPIGNIEKLEPRQAFHYVGKGQPIFDGEPSIAAIQDSETAIFMAVINSKNVHLSNHSKSFYSENNKMHFTVSSQKVLDEIKNKKGYVYVFEKTFFEPYSRDGNATERSEWRAYQDVKPFEVIEVDSGDLPENIEVKDFL